MAHTQADAHQLFSRFLNASTRFGLTVSLRKTEVMLQPVNRLTSLPPVIIAGETALPAVEKFCYLGSTLSSDVNIDNDISSRLDKTSHSFGRLSRRLRDDHGIRLDTKVAVYKAVVMTALLYGSETCRHVRKLEQFHLRCLRRLAHVRWQEKKSNTEVLQICNITVLASRRSWLRLNFAGLAMCCAWMITDYQRPFSAVNWRRAHFLAVDSESVIRKRWRPTWSAATLHLPSSKS